MITTSTLSTAGPTAHAGTRTPAARARWAWLALGTAAHLLAVGGRWDTAAAAWLFPVLLLRFARTSRAWSGALWLWAANTTAAVFWLVESALFSPVALAGAAALAALLTLPFLLDRLLTGRLRPWAALLVFPAAVAGAEFLITLLSPFGTAYGSLAVTQDGMLPLLQLVSVTGSYGIGFLIAWCAAVANLAWERASWHAARRAVLTCAAVLLAVVLAGGARLAFLPPDGPTVRIAGVSADATALRAQKAAYAQADGGRAALATAPPASLRPALRGVLDTLLAATRREAAAGAGIVVWPEQGVRALAADEPAVIAAAREEARRSRIHLEIGIGVHTAQAPSYGRNETLLIDPRGTVRWTYQKAHPIPGSETFTPGDGRVPVVATPYGRLANVICYDADFPDMMRVPADIMLVPSHDWREYGSAHTRKAALRAVEAGYALFRQDAEGVTTAFDNQGHVLATTDYFGTDRQATVAYVPVHGTTTVYDRIGDTFAWLCLAAVGTLVVAGTVSGRRTAARGTPVR
ncbi:nitrilase-related carbon-nitrogen hydrolase [Streptomyces sp. MspMP-M5]|uniref:nitrilase-related carbon-nitrogen hydrolase n=1 Tax=unclassified Streptomyces TaxID=2593676 RepID=UPI00035F0A10|nr:nitrilase-related carbon-nitrogen hydrolase [Streptomyces sp. MspMP-M5]